MREQNLLIITRVTISAPEQPKMANDRRSDGGMMMGMSIKVMSSMALFILVFSGSEALAQERLAIVWTDSTKDVHVNGALDRAAQVLTSDETRRMVLISPKLELAAVLDLSGRTVMTTAKDVFRLSSDRASAQSVADFSVDSAGNYTVFDDSDYYFTISGTRVLITAHQGLTGETDNQKVFETVPVWRSLMDGYQPDISAVAVIKSIQAETTITVALATWCSDSKQHVPRLLKALDAAGNPHLHIKLIGIARQLREPAETIKQRKIVRVPTVIVERDGVELGRIVENPAAKTIEQDLAAILNGTRNTPPTNEKEHARTWGYTDIEMIKLRSPGKVEILTYESSRMRLGRDRTFEFKTLEGQVKKKVSEFLLKHVERPLSTTFVASEERPQYAIPVRHRHSLGGDQCTLKI